MKKKERKRRKENEREEEKKKEKKKGWILQIRVGVLSLISKGDFLKF